MDPMIKNSFFTILIYWNDNRIHLGLTKKLIFFILFPPLLQVFVQNNQFLTKKVTSVCVLASSYYFVFVFETFRGNHVGTNIGFSEVQDSLAPAPTQENISFKVQLSEILTPSIILLKCFDLSSNFMQPSEIEISLICVPLLFVEL